VAAVKTQLFRDTIPSRYAKGPVAVTIGSFDGFHCGHQVLLKTLRRRAEECGCSQTVVVSFEPHPSVTLGISAAVPAIADIRQRLAVLSRYSITALRIVRFDQEIARLSARAFIEKYLVGELGAGVLVVGPDAAIGKGREASAERLPNLLAPYGCETTIVPFTSGQDGNKIGSRRIRSLIADGEMEHATMLLGRPFSVDAHVRHGDHRGQELGFRTANLSFGRRVIPRFGVYACFALVNQQLLPAVTNVGVRPTFGGGLPMVEAHILDQSELNLYGKRIELFFNSRIRDEVKFASREALMGQIAADVGVARERLSGEAKEALSNWLFVPEGTI
jgi:riboflavin kinase/FMN adenylyltransferase